MFERSVDTYSIEIELSLSDAALADNEPIQISGVLYVRGN